MGTWSHEPFGNDGACDWAESLVESDSVAPIREALESVASSDATEIDSSQAEEAVAAAAVLAKMLGGAGQTDAYTEDVDAWIGRQRRQVDSELRLLAIRSLGLIMSPDSELRQLWDEGKEPGKWLESMNGLIAQLKG